MSSVNEEPISFTRREALRWGALGASALGAGGLVAACGSSSATPSATLSTKTTPRRGGTLQAGLSGGTSTDTLDPLTWENLVDGARCFALYDSLVAFDKNALPQLSLAQEFEPNANATEWTVRLRPGITFHDGRPLTADDVIYTYQQIVNPKLPLIGAASLVSGGVDVAGMRKLDKLTVRIPCSRPFASLDELNACYNFFIIPVGFNPKRPIGTGAFKYVSFTPGQQSVFVRNDNYWGTGPYLDKLVITDFADESSQVNGLLSGQVDVVDALSVTSIAPVQSGGANVLIALGGGHTPLTMRVDQAPFNDARVRQAFRLIPDRQQMINLIFGGHGTLGNDLFANYDPSYDHALPQRQQDLAQAKYLLKQAGHEKLTVEMITSDIAGGTVKLAEVFAEQASGAGVTVNLNQINSTEFFGPNYCKWTFAQDWWQYYPYLPRVQWSMLPVSPFNECHVDDPVYNRLYDQAVSTVDLATRTQIIHEMQTREWEGLSSGYIIPYFMPIIDAYSKHVHGVTGSRVGLPLGCYDFKSFWMD